MSDTNPATLVPYVLQEAFVATNTGRMGSFSFVALALGSIITFIAILAGSAATMKYQVWRIERQG